MSIRWNSDHGPQVEVYTLLVQILQYPRTFYTDLDNLFCKSAHRLWPSASSIW
jgi:hypothetical protein